MHLIFRPWIVLLASAALAAAAAQESAMFSASSKAQGAPFDLVAAETHRCPAKSYLEVPGFRERTAPGARWLMCAYTALAVHRGFSHWVVVYPPEGSDKVVVAFSNASATLPSELLGSDYAKDRMIGEGMMPVEAMAGFCGIPLKR